MKVEAMDGVPISVAAKRLGVSPTHLRTLERDGRVPSVRRVWFGRCYSEADIALLRGMGIGTRPRRLREIEVAGGA